MVFITMKLGGSIKNDETVLSGFGENHGLGNQYSIHSCLLNTFFSTKLFDSSG
jgi:hypothetical protein